MNKNVQKKKKNAPYYQKKGVEKNAWQGNSFGLFFPPVQNSRKVRGHKQKKKPLIITNFLENNKTKK